MTEDTTTGTRDIGQLPFFAAQTDEASTDAPFRSPFAPPSGRRSAPPEPEPVPEPAHAAPTHTLPASRSALAAAGLDESGAASVALQWDVVAGLREQVANLLAQSELSSPGLSDASRHALAQAHIADVIRSQVDDMVRLAGGTSAWDPRTQNAMAKAIFDSLFKLGRLQPLVDQPEVENIDIYGFDNVWVTYASGEKKRHAPVASSDAELMAEIAFLAARGGETGRAFTATNPILDMDLPGGARLAAVAPPISPRPKIVIRIHRFVDITLDDLVVNHRTLTPAMSGFLDAAVKAGKSMVVAGHPNAGKTTLVRALCNSIDPFEEIVTIEKERELHLDRMNDRHHIITALQYRPGQGERTVDGSRPGEITMVELLEEALRLNAQRIVVGEVRGGEIDAMFQAMQAGVGSLSTLHAESPANAIERMATLTQRSLNTSDAYAYRQIAQHINFIVQVSKVRDAETGLVRRIVTEIAEVGPGEQARPIATPIFRADPYTHEQVALNRPREETLAELVHAGFDANLLLPGHSGASV
ncbi:ATP-binding cassette domain-containing protein [Cryobacterium melibiosiphilum]|uniref:ATP-binding cassette domain-containing protein n=1 Tax=Cryobacterium melibiosiphilum TaxID=995039 RepID=A0A3A5MGR4_9MICO|nr:type II/IV secretion system ATPase subunit [Cryobacterium melibiosiphilum]RJT84746.1 ATP-binding cassette domain-containing protein [Cryobacterium melibiosiphilum]